MSNENSDVIDFIVDTSVAAAKTWRWFWEPLTLASAQAWTLQHVIRNRFLSSVLRPAWASRCPDLAIVRKTIGQMREELVYDDVIKKAHTEILWEFGRNLGLTDEQMNNAKPEPLCSVFFNTVENLARTRHWLVGWLSSSISEFVSFHINDHNLNPEMFKRALGMTEEQVFFLRYHEKADKEHAGRKVWEPIRRHMTSPEVRRQLEDGLYEALAAHGCYYEGVAQLGEQLAREGVGR